MQRFGELESQRLRAVATVAALPETDRSAIPPGWAWSPAQVLTHLVLSEQEFLRRIATTAEMGTAGLRPRRPPFINIACFLGRHPFFAIPAPESLEPPGDASLESAARIWEVVRGDLRGWLETVDDPVRTVFCIHPIFGALSANQLLDVMEAHGIYHAKRHFQKLERR